MSQFGGMEKFTPNVQPLKVAGQNQFQLGGANLKQAQGTARLVQGWNPVSTGGPQGGPVSQAPIGDMNTPRGAQPIALAGQAAHAAPPAPPAVHAQAQPGPALSGPEEMHAFTVQAMGRDRRVYTAELSVGFPPGTNVVGHLPPTPPRVAMGSNEESHVFVLRGIDGASREHLREMEVFFPVGVGQPTVAERTQ